MFAEQANRAKKTIITVSATLLGLSLLAEACLAATCPTVNALKSNQATGWLAYDSDDGHLLTEKRDQTIRHNISEFALAEWSQKRQSIHCYYRDKNGSDLDVYFAKSHFTPANANHYWYNVSGYLQCAAGEQQCEFNSRHA